MLEVDGNRQLTNDLIVAYNTGTYYVLETLITHLKIECTFHKFES